MVGAWQAASGTGVSGGSGHDHLMCMCCFFCHFNRRELVRLILILIVKPAVVLFLLALSGLFDGLSCSVPTALVVQSS